MSTHHTETTLRLPTGRLRTITVTVDADDDGPTDREHPQVMACFVGIRLAQIAKAHYGATVEHQRSPVSVGEGGGRA